MQLTKPFTMFNYLYPYDFYIEIRTELELLLKDERLMLEDIDQFQEMLDDSLKTLA